ncbi:hypothetical protein PAPYR_8480 [Paratrimastix pyriformis]|uniref:Uncharacterized protein n=1 Tax=Paratrimastix pyriformis TaxID=342808 RepID=A0ABQ8UG47_9EUKA|nr:hypothetical protein PAPYR_8480 [Paratrimastix pyriformis]
MQYLDQPTHPGPRPSHLPSRTHRSSPLEFHHSLQTVFPAGHLHIVRATSSAAASRIPKIAATSVVLAFFAVLWRAKYRERFGDLEDAPRWRLPLRKFIIFALSVMVFLAAQFSDNKPANCVRIIAMVIVTFAETLINPGDVLRHGVLGGLCAFALLLGGFGIGQENEALLLGHQIVLLIVPWIDYLLILMTFCLLIVWVLAPHFQQHSSSLILVQALTCVKELVKLPRFCLLVLGRFHVPFKNTTCDRIPHNPRRIARFSPHFSPSSLSHLPPHLPQRKSRKLFDSFAPLL